MASEIDICNLALARLGDEATLTSISPPEGSAQADHCARFYPIARDTLLDMHTWSFATKRKELAQLSATPPAGWLYAYALPPDAVRLIAVLEPESPDDTPMDFEHEVLEDGSKVIYANIPEAVLRYTFRQTDTTKFSPLFVDALAMLLAGHLAGPIIKGADGARMAQQWLTMGRAQFAAAVQADANQRQVVPTHSPTWVASR